MGNKYQGCEGYRDRGYRLASDIFGSVIPTIRPLIPFIVGFAVFAAGCGGTQRDPGHNSPSSTDPVAAVTNDGVTTTTTEPSATSRSAVSSTTSIPTTPPDTTPAEVEETVPSTNPTTTTTSIETLTPDVETFEPEAPQTGFITHEPNA